MKGRIVTLRKNTVFVVEKRITQEDKQPHLYYAHIRHTDSDSDKPTSVEPQVTVNHWGTIVSKEPINEIEKLTPKERRLLQGREDDNPLVTFEEAFA